LTYRLNTVGDVCGPITFSVNTNSGGQTSSPVIVGNIVPSIMTRVTRLAAAASVIQISGDGSGGGFGNSQVTPIVSLSSGTCTAYSTSSTGNPWAGSFGCEFATPPQIGPLLANVTINGVTSDNAVIGTIVSNAQPASNTANLGVTAPTLIITGTEFGTIQGDITITLSHSATCTVVDVTDTTINCTLSTVNPPRLLDPADNIFNATVNKAGGKFGPVQVRTLVPSTPFQIDLWFVFLVLMFVVFAAPVINPNVGGLEVGKATNITITGINFGTIKAEVEIALFSQTNSGFKTSCLQYTVQPTVITCTWATEPPLGGIEAQIKRHAKQLTLW